MGEPNSSISWEEVETFCDVTGVKKARSQFGRMKESMGKIKIPMTDRYKIK